MKEGNIGKSGFRTLTSEEVTAVSGGFGNFGEGGAPDLDLKFLKPDKFKDDRIRDIPVNDDGGIDEFIEDNLEAWLEWNSNEEWLVEYSEEEGVFYAESDSGQVTAFNSDDLPPGTGDIA